MIPFVLPWNVPRAPRVSRETAEKWRLENLRLKNTGEVLEAKIAGLTRERDELRAERDRLREERFERSVATEELSAFDRMTVLKTLYPAGPGVAGEHARIWRRVFAAHPELIEDLARIGGLYALRPRTYDPTGTALPEPVDPYQLAIDQGRREAVLEILAHNLSLAEINSLTEDRNA